LVSEITFPGEMYSSPEKKMQVLISSPN